MRGKCFPAGPQKGPQVKDRGGGFGISISEMSCDPKICILTARTYSLTFGEEIRQFIRKLELEGLILQHIEHKGQNAICYLVDIE
jgi:hypothetical protein